MPVRAAARLARTAPMAALLAALVSCAPPVSSGDFNAPDPASRMYAIERAARHDDRSAVPSIVTCLDSDDPAERLLASEALRTMTGETFGYSPWGPPAERREAIDRWVDAVQNGTLNLTAPLPGEPRS